MKWWFSDIRQQEIGHCPSLAPGEFPGVLREGAAWQEPVVGQVRIRLNWGDRAEGSGRQNLQAADWRGDSRPERELWRWPEGLSGVLSWDMTGSSQWGNHLRPGKNLPHQREQNSELTHALECSFSHRPERVKVGPGLKNVLILCNNTEKEVQKQG